MKEEEKRDGQSRYNGYARSGVCSLSHGWGWRDVDENQSQDSNIKWLCEDPNKLSVQDRVPRRVGRSRQILCVARMM